ncbi:TetR/AcrR family transcriptional regulator [Dermatophilus congolensis]|uniref:TetR/AcrR family transcriptional regulator n=1 Tax=Dermatophilus congolensis TaxID=1863 RepID=UPI001AAE33EE|nr:TetR/AcrR family transcriptional regulator [Dermatophilus congolensis]MBO3142724.1 TetR/AcrR family transcriptional regulator [Dermatophilus congolensis]MBO3151716.1 TetR/AcrR family transcriptional regulator [Dermatophilus congolensis]MBO3161283.1 TetR/AcrR family transcriptional regulator [Dermatophilus congolensis]MBO3162998.1 TetR/AcrR family transcriptional regulator [Dermatophilus congolensis]MBO3176550.1 TetR/AcrR family transcriptional regulator [Dermatophilus congolensis]
MNSLAEQLVSTAAALLDESGLGRVTIREVARRSGVSHGAPRRYFPTLESLLAAVARQGFLDLQVALDNAGDSCLAWAQAYLAFADRRPNTFELLFRHESLEGAGAQLREISLPLLTTWVQRYTVEHAQTTRDDALAAWSGIHGVAALSARGALRLVQVDATDLLLKTLR